MISSRQVHFIEEHWEAIARRALGRIRTEMPHSHELPETMIHDRVEDLFGHLGDWLIEAEPGKLASRYEQLGRRRQAEGIALHDMVRSFQIIRQCAVDYVRDNQLHENVVQIRSESELEYRIDRFFDLVLYHFVKGYEPALRSGTSRVALTARGL